MHLDNTTEKKKILTWSFFKVSGNAISRNRANHTVPGLVLQEVHEEIPQFSQEFVVLAVSFLQGCSFL